MLQMRIIIIMFTTRTASDDRRGTLSGAPSTASGIGNLARTHPSQQEFMSSSDDNERDRAARRESASVNGRRSAPGATLVYEASVLMGDYMEIRIVHGGVTYRLRRTVTNKLILTK